MGGSISNCICVIAPSSISFPTELQLLLVRFSTCKLTLTALGPPYPRSQALMLKAGGGGGGGGGGMSLGMRLVPLHVQWNCACTVDMSVLHFFYRGFAAFVSYFINHPLYTPACELMLIEVRRGKRSLCLKPGSMHNSACRT